MTKKFVQTLLSFPTVLITAAIFLVVLIFLLNKPYFQISSDLNNLVKHKVIPLSKYCLDYSVGGEYGSVLIIKLSDDFDNLSLREQWREFKKLMDAYDAPRWSIVAKNKPKVFDNVSVNFLPDIVANTSKNKYEFSSVDSITINGKLYVQEQVLYGEDFFEVKDIIFDPPIEVSLISTNGTILAATSRYDLVDYEIYSDWKSALYSHPKATQLLDEGKVYFLADAKVLLLEYYGEFAKISLLESQYDKHEGQICWVRKNSIQH